MKKIALYTLGLLLSVGATAQKGNPPVKKPETKIDRSHAPAPAAAPKIQIGSYQFYTLENGLKVIVVENHKLPTVSYSLELDIDPVKEGSKAGAAGFAGDLMSSGTNSRNKDQIASSVDFIGAQFSTSSTNLYGSCLTKHAEALLEIMSDVLTHPVFPAEELEKLRKQALSGLESEKTDPNSISTRIGNQVKYGKNHPYGENTTEESIQGITREDLVAYYSTYFKPNVAYLVIVGDIKPEVAKAQAEKYFGSWTKGEVPSKKFRTPKAPEGNEVVFVPLTGAVQSVIDITYPIELMPASQDALVAGVLNNVLGGSGFQTRLMQNLREDKAYTYGAYSEIVPDKVIGYFSAAASVRNEVTDSSLTQFLFEMDRLTREPIDEKTLQTVKNIMSGQFARSLERPQTVARFAMNIEKYKLAPNFYETYLERLNAVTADQVMAMAQRVIKPQNCFITVVGNADEIKNVIAFDKDGKITKLNPDGSAFSDMKPAPAGMTASDVAHKYIDFLGGEKKLSAIKGLEMKGSMDVGMAKLDMIQQMIPMQASRSEFSMAGKTYVVQIWDGEKMIMSQMGQKIDADQDMTNDAKEQADLLADLHPELYGATATLKGIDLLNGKEVYAVEVDNGKGRVQTHLYDTQNGMRLKTKTVSKKGETNEISETNYLEYKEVDGMKFPSHIKQSAAGQNMEIIFDEINTKAKLKKKSLIAE